MPNDGFGHVVKHEIYATASYTDEELAALAREGGPSSVDAVEALLCRYEIAIYRACLSYLRDIDKAEDASQEVLIRVYRGINRFQGRSSFRTWLYRVVRNECYSVASQHARHRVCESLDEIVHPLHAVATGDFTSSIEVNNTVHTALQRLGSNDREVIQLRFFSDLSLNLIANQLNTSLSGAKMRLYRAIARFEKAYVDLEADAATQAPA
ncbi:MAG: sigma-70 family RNA polymerase sigma factor [Gammaproteobacteria bacterium]|nr:sigma-70 family RNA polymerase sigma factor [Gammaproteobacteria bacterium]